MTYTRVKESGVGSTVVSYTGYKRENSACTVYTNGTGSFTSERDWKITHGVDVPNYYARKRRGELLPMTAFHQWEESGSASGQGLVSKSTLACKTYPNYWTTPSVPSFLSAWYIAYDMATPDAVHAKAAEALQDEYYVQAAAAKIYASGWDALTFASELDKTVQMFKGFVKNLAKNLRSPMGPERLWLEGRYGWRQVMFDIKDIQKAINSIDDRRKRYRQSAGGSSNSTELSTKAVSWVSGTHVYPVVDTYEVNTRGTVVADITPPKIQLNPVITGWELTRLSFVLDWVINVGQWLEAMSFLVFSQQYVAAMGVQVRCTRTLSDPLVTWSQYHSGSITGSSTWTCTLQMRNPVKVPMTPLVKLRIDAWKALDLYSLLRLKQRPYSRR